MPCFCQSSFPGRALPALAAHPWADWCLPTTRQVSDNFVRMDLKSRGSSRFKRKGSLRSKARGGAAGGSWGRYGRGSYGSKWGRQNGTRGTDRGGWAGGEDPVTGERGEAPRDRPLSSGGAKNRAGLDVLDQVRAAGGEGQEEGFGEACEGRRCLFRGLTPPVILFGSPGTKLILLPW